MTTPNPAAQDRIPVTVVGLGPMGAALADALLAHGHPTTVWNRSPHRAEPLVTRGARRADTITEAVAASPLVVVCLKDYEAMYAVLDPAADALSGRLVVNHSSGTPEEARAAASWADGHSVGYLDGAIMVPVPAVGRPDAVLLYSGPEPLFTAHRAALESLGGATYLGADPSLAVLYNTALLGMMYASLNGFLHAAALVGTAGVSVESFAGIALDWFLPSVIGTILRSEVPQIDARTYPGDAGSMEMNLTALDHIVRTSAEQGVDVDFPAALRTLAERAIAEGYAANNYSVMIEVFRKQRAAVS
ncbi:NAD(P)-dependent oxidoreductase [Streptoalloteichus tenebrarius]|uniref:NAD(P)-dependent oxidoreductase n=1 Tax=Streptoalloteichus tenebrarius (strain ATCC 17920 / DSM 40477 / JCM 4838 / CBS 697.72 / NBRC 16177 / NCIMB 11028 / NRRL B-12390 / A12253. 1 / ISP 5477) TaxID=1933 RepID=UPI0036D3F0F4